MHYFFYAIENPRFPESFDRAGSCWIVLDMAKEKSMRIESAVKASFLVLAWSGLGLWASVQLPIQKPDTTMSAMEAIAGKGLIHSHAYRFLEELTDNIGGRVTGTPQASQAIEWSLAKMKAIGLNNVHSEKWTLFRGWARVSASAELVSPVRKQLTIASWGWVGSTQKDGVEGDLTLVDRSRLEDEIKERSSSWAGKILLTKGEGAGTWTEMARFGRFVDAAAAAKATAIIVGRVRSRTGDTATGMVDTKYHEIPVVSMAREDQQLLERLLDRGDTPRLRINVENRATTGPVDSANVVGEIVGTENPEQVVVVGAHLDSWDLAQGATDNGNGVAAVLGAAEAILETGFRPKRTIRFVLFTGEEQGLLGSFAYVKSHSRELANHVAAVVVDWGDGPAVALDLGPRDDLLPEVTAFAQTISAFNQLRVRDRNEFGTDTGPFILAGLPGISIYQDSTDLEEVTHTTADTFDNVNRQVLTRNAVLMSLLSFWIADRANRLASPWPPERSAQALLRKDRQRVQDLKAFGWWPFGELDGELKSDNP